VDLAKLGQFLGGAWDAALAVGTWGLAPMPNGLYLEDHMDLKK
jgi:hypothetical protein